MRRAAWISILLLGLVLALPARAEVGVTDECQEDADKLSKEIDRDEDDYTAESLNNYIRAGLATP